jgi:hypothetical protein
MDCRGGYNLGMTESEPEPRKWEIEKPEHFQETFNEFLADAELGSAKYQAFMDFYRQLQLKQQRWDDLRILEEADPVPRRVRYESALRLIEFELALVNYEINHKETELPGYHGAFGVVSEIVSDLADASRTEIKHAQPETSEEQQVRFSQSKIYQVMTRSYLALMTKIAPQ